MPCRPAFAFTVLLAASGALFGQVSSPIQAPPSPAIRASAEVTSAPYFRLHESDDGSVLTMQLAMREFRIAAGPSVWLVAAVHIGDRPFYQALQAKLDAMDVVLFEGVQPPGGGRDTFDLAPPSDEARAETTKRRIRFLAGAAEAHRAKQGELPASMDALSTGVSERLAELISANANDAWGRAFLFTVNPVAQPVEEEAAAAAPKLGRGFEIVSLGADGEPGGDGPAADFKWSEQEPLKPGEVPKRAGSRGLQQQMASALGLVFQLDVMDHTKPNWRSSDLSIDQVQERLAKAGADADELFGMLEGSGFQAGIAKLVMGLMKLFPAAQTYGKIAIMEAMARADELLAVVPGNMALAMDVIIHDRNAVVIDDLRAVLAGEPGVKTVGIIYGGGHMADLEKSLRELGFAEAAVEWQDAITLDLNAAGIDVREARQIRQTLSRALDAQIKAANRRKRPTK